MTALNSEGLEKAAEALAKLYRGEGDEPFHLMATATITAYLSALPPVDGLEVVAWDVAPKGLPAEPTKSHSFVAEIERQGGVISPLVTLSQASSVIAGLKARVAELEKALTKIDAIRNSIIGFQKVGWSDHVYPLVAALEEAGFSGKGYDVMRAEIRTMLAAEARISSLEEENKRMRAVVSASAAALGNGAAISTQASIEFMELLPVEIGKFCDRLEGDKTQLQRKIDLLEATVSFVRRWAIEKEGNGTSAEERLSAIANHPGIIGHNLEDHNG